MLTDSHDGQHVAISKRMLIWIVCAALLLAAAVAAYVYTKHAADVRHERITAAQGRLDKYLSAEKKLDQARAQYSSADKQSTAAFRKASTAAQRRHDLAVGPNWDLQTEYSYLQSEASGVAATQDNVAKMFRVNQKEIEVYAALYGEDAVSKIRADEQKQESLGWTWLSTWANAVADMKDNDESRINGNDASDYNNSDVDHYYAQSNEAENELVSMKANVGVDWAVLKRRFNEDLERARDSLRTAQHT
jgi:hypothetical protein